jgi:methylisocitrate lyase
MTRKQFRRMMKRPAPQVVVAPLALDAMSAALAKKIGFDAVYLGGGALGYSRGVSEALLTATEVAECARAITECVDISLVVDGTTGFGDAVHVHRTVRLLEQVGAAAVEIEDQLAPKRAHHQKGIDHMIQMQEMVGKIATAVDSRTDSDFLIIARCNALSHGGLDDALERCAAYTEAGADMLLLFPRNHEEFRAISAGTTLPLVGMKPTGHSEPELRAAGYALDVDAFSATLFGFRALKDAYLRMKDGGEVVDDFQTALDSLEEVGATIDIHRLLEIEAKTTERELYEGGRQ